MLKINLVVAYIFFAINVRDRDLYSLGFGPLEMSTTTLRVEKEAVKGNIYKLA
jgi:hypothetical protein